MNVLRVMQLMQRSIPLAAAIVVGATSVASAQRQGQELFEWSGRVDREVQITMRDGRVNTRDIGNNDYTRGNARVFGQMPHQDGQVRASIINGRGNVDVIQQPDARNGFTTIVRIQDRSGGADNYRIATYWQGNANGDIGRDRARDDRNGGSVGYPNGNGNIRGGMMLHWSGNVDGELEIRLQNGRVDYRTVSGAKPTSTRADLGNQSAQRYVGSVAIGGMQGRGQVNVIQQPTSQNGYTTVIRVRDPQGGYGYYSFDVIAQ
jgi:hypothetical protein